MGKEGVKVKFHSRPPFFKSGTNVSFLLLLLQANKKKRKHLKKSLRKVAKLAEKDPSKKIYYERFGKAGKRFAKKKQHKKFLLNGQNINKKAKQRQNVP